MVKIRSRLQRKLRRLSYVSFALVIAMLPLTISSSAHAECVIPDFGPGVHEPVGADASSYTYNCTSGLYESEHFTFDPVTGDVKAKDVPVYTYNPTTGKYDSGTWYFNAPTGTFLFSPFSVLQPPANATVVGAPAPAPATNTISNTGANSNNTIDNQGGVTNGSSISNTGQGSNNTIDGTATNNQNTTDRNTIHVNNTLDSTASTGDAAVLKNTTGGSATSGDAQSQANIINLLQSSSNALDGNTLTFVANIDGDVDGDFMLDPAAIANVQPAGGGVGDNNLTLNTSTDASINNTIDLTAKSGDATVDSNTNAGDATSGTAKTIANIVNVINSAIMSGRSFIGTININGNLNGDILIPDNLVDQLIAANVPTVTITNTGANSNNSVTNNSGSNNTNVTNTNDSNITNNVNATADSGDATVTANTNAGDATSGEATNSITAFNLTGSNIIGCNAILVFVNVAGSWVGMIVNAPPGTTAAALGGCLRNGSANNNINIDNDSDLSITNDINSTATSGNARVSRNTRAGSARSGDAKNTVNLLNIENSVLSLDGWFGILFINVFGSWHGSFGINTAAGNKPIAVPTPGSGGGGTAETATISSFPYVFSFVPTPGSTDTSNTSAVEGTNTTSTNAILASKITAAKSQSLPQISAKRQNTWVLPVSGLVLGILLLAAERVVSLRQRS